MLRAGFNLFWNEGQWELIPFLFWFLVTSPLVVFFVIPVLYLLDGRKKKSFQRLKNFPVALLSWEAIGNWIRGIVCLTPGESESEVAQSCPTLCDPMDCSPPGSSVHGIFQARILEWVAISPSRGSSQTRDRTHVSCIFYTGRRLLYCWATREALLHYNTCVYCSSLTPPVPHIKYRVNHTMDVVFLKGGKCQRSS